MPFHGLGSLWRRWDLHFHTPTSFDYKNRFVTNEQIVEWLRKVGVAVIAITDHYVMDIFRIRTLQKLGAMISRCFEASSSERSSEGRRAVMPSRRTTERVFETGPWIIVFVATWPLAIFTSSETDSEPQPLRDQRRKITWEFLSLRSFAYHSSQSLSTGCA